MEFVKQNEDYKKLSLHFEFWNILLQNLVHYRPPSQGSSPCPSIQSFAQAGNGSYSNANMEHENSDYMKSALCQIKEENSHNSGWARTFPPTFPFTKYNEERIEIFSETKI